MCLSRIVSYHKQSRSLLSVLPCSLRVCVHYVVVGSAQVDWLPGENFYSREVEEEREKTGSLAGDPGCTSQIASSRGIPDGRFRDGRLLYINE